MFGRKLHRLLGTIVVLGLAVTLLAQGARAQTATFSWDPNLTNGVSLGGSSGTWNTNSTGNWWNGTSDSAWTDTTGTAAALFGGTAGAVTVSGNNVVNALIFNTAGYSLSSGTVTLAGTTPTIAMNATSGTIGSILTGTGSLLKNGSGALTLSNPANSYSGGTTVSGGTLIAIGSGADNGSSPLGSNNVTVNSGAQLNYNSYAFGYGHANRLTLNSATAVQGNGVYDYLGTVNLNNTTGSGSTWTMGTGANPHGQVMGNIVAPSITTTGSGNSITSGGGALPGAAFNVAPAGGAIGLTVSAPILDYNGTLGSVSLTGGGILVLTASNTYSGGTTISGGTLSIGSGGTTGSIGSTSGVLIASNATLAFNRTDSYGGNFTRAISGAGGVILQAGALTLPNANTFTGGFTINGGMVVAGNASAFGSNTLTLGGGTFTTSSALTFANPVYLASGTTTNVSGGYTVNNYPTLAGAFTGNGTFLNDYAGGNGVSNTFITGDISQFTGTISFVNVSGAGNNFQFTGGGGNNANGSQAHFVVNGATSGGGAFYPIETAGITFQMGDLSGTGGLITSTAAGTLQIGALNTNTTFSGVIASSSGINKVGTGSLTLGGVNTYTGGTTVSGGTLDFTKANTGVSAVALNGGMLLLDFSAGGTTNNILASTDTLALGGGTLAVHGSSTIANTQGFNGLTMNAGGSFLTPTGGTTTITLAAITRSTAGGTVDFTLPTNGSITTTTANANPTGGTQTILGGYATANGGSTWAVSGNGASAGTISGLSTYSPSFTAATDVDAPTGSSSPAAATYNSLRLNNQGSYSLGLASGTTTIATGGILETANVGANAASITGGSLTTGNGLDLIVQQYNPSAALTIGSLLVNSGTTAIGLTESGPGQLTVTGLNSYTGNVTINGGTLTETNASQFGAAATYSALGNLTTAGRSVTINSGATLQFGGDNQWGGPQGTAPALGLVINAGGNVVAYSGNTNTLGNVTLNGGTLTTNNGYNST